MRLAFRAVRRPFLLAGLTLLAGAAQAAAQAETTEYYGTDAVGSVRIVFDASGAVLGRQDYDPFGREILAAWAVPPERFGGQSTDGEVQQGYFHARQFQGRTGRFAMPDSFFNLKDPQRWNRYTYALGNPVRYSDANGENPVNSLPPGDYPYDPIFGGGGDVDGFCAYRVGHGCGDEKPPSNPGPTSPTTPTTPTTPTGPTTPPGKPTPLTCHAGTQVSDAEWFEASRDVATMFVGWNLGIGPTDYDCGPNSLMAKSMSNAYGLQERIDAFLAGTKPPQGFVGFGLPGLLGSGTNPAGQFVDGYHYDFSLDPGNILNVTLENSTTPYSFFYHAPLFTPDVPTRPFWLPMGRINQTFHLSIQCTTTR